MTAPPLPRRLAAEAVGSALLVATVVGSGIMGERMAQGNLGVALLGNTAATGAMLFVLITALGPISGAHFNPAVSLVFALRRELAWHDAGCFILAQLAGAIVGTVVAHAMFSESIVTFSTQRRTGGGQWLSESIATFALVVTILATRRARPDAVPAAVALVIVAGYWFTASTSFANPAVTISRSLTDSFSGIAPADVVPFVIAQLGGGLIGLLGARLLFDPAPPIDSAPR